MSLMEAILAPSRTPPNVAGDLDGHRGAMSRRRVGAITTNNVSGMNHARAIARVSPPIITVLPGFDVPVIPLTTC
jgi:hypothetical protein